jgi:hypothetical protein
MTDDRCWTNKVRRREDRVRLKGGLQSESCTAGGIKDPSPWAPPVASQNAAATQLDRQTATAAATATPQPGLQAVMEVQQAHQPAVTEQGPATLAAPPSRQAPTTRTEATELLQDMELPAVTETRTALEQEGVLMTLLTLHYLNREEGKLQTGVLILSNPHEAMPLWESFKGVDLNIIKRYCFRKFWSKI